MRRTARNATLLVAVAACRAPFEQTLAYSTDAPSRAGLIRAGQGVVAANDFGTVVLLDASGRAAWRAPVCREVAARPAAAGDTLVVACASGEWVGLALADGKERWRSSTKGAVSTPLASDGARAFGVDQDGTLWALDAGTGALLWRRPAELKPAKDRRPFTAPVVWNGSLAASLAEAGLWVLDPATGIVRFHLPTRGLTGLFPLGERLLVLWPSGKMGALEKGGTWAWSRELGAPALSGPAVVNEVAWVGLEGNVLLGLSPENGNEAARFALPAPALGRVAGLGDLVAVPTSGPEGRVLAFRRGQAQAVFDARTDSPVRTDAVALEGQVLVAPTDGRVLGFRPRPER